MPRVIETSSEINISILFSLLILSYCIIRYSAKISATYGPVADAKNDKIRTIELLVRKSCIEISPFFSYISSTELRLLRLSVES